MGKFGVRPEKEKALEERMKALGIKDQELEESFVTSSGPGGQKVNKTATCVRLKHIPTGIEVKVQQERTQGLNRFLARRLICEQLEQKLLGKDSPQQKAQEKLRKQKQRRHRRAKKKVS